MKCLYCDKQIDLVKDHYAHSVTHGVYFHLPCFNEYELLVRNKEVKNLYDTDELRSLSTARSKR